MSRKNLVIAFVFASIAGCNGGSWNSGDRVLVAKCLYDTRVIEPRRFDVVVFKYPESPVDRNTPKNYIKRLIGLPGEIIAIFFGRLYRYTPGDQEIPYRREDEGIEPRNLWRRENVHGLGRPDSFAETRFKEGKFEILRKPPDIMLALRRIVYDNDYPPRDLERMVPPRWNPARKSGWKDDGKQGFVHNGEQQPGIDWLRYQHIVVERSLERPASGGEFKPQLITDRMGYNSFVLQGGAPQTPYPNWVGDLMLECNVEVQKSQGELIFELSKGIYRFQAQWNLADGVCKLVRIDQGGKEEALGEPRATRLREPGSYLVRFANIDARLTVWVDRELPLGDGVTYAPPEVRGPGEDIDDDKLVKRRGPTENDLQPASLGSKGAAVAVKHLRLWRDTYYTTHPQGPDWNPQDRRADDIMPAEAWGDPGRWEPLQKLSFRTLYVQPGHYLCLGDNSTASSDSRDWGLVPERLMLGRALAVYYPVHRLGPIR